MFTNLRFLACRTLILILVLFWQGFPTSSQTTTGSISGVVVDTQGAVIPDANIILFGAQDGQDTRALKTKSDIDGRFTFKDLVPGHYILKISHIILNIETEKLIDIPYPKNVDVAIELGRACSELSRKANGTMEMDKAEVVRLTLTKAIDRLLTVEERKEGFILSTKNIKPKWIVNKSVVRIKLMSPGKIQQKADRHGDFLYMSFSEVRSTGGCIAVSVNHSWAVGNNSKISYVSGGGITYEYRKEAGRWIGKKVAEWVS
jgi:Carboxypeptidase regulatory-like domain